MAERICLDLVRTIFPLEKKVRLLGVSLSNLGSGGSEAEPQLALDLE
jgi:hypothetical protein